MKFLFPAVFPGLAEDAVFEDESDSVLCLYEFLACGGEGLWPGLVPELVFHRLSHQFRVIAALGVVGAGSLEFF